MKINKFHTFVNECNFIKLHPTVKSENMCRTHESAIQTQGQGRI